ncbi:MazG nucleotide pyrophosphohydrolase domain-containing protein [Acetivibrio saccincola]|jgi:NTP pyrophosphatase (non-canonical NTP hydrolase)|uniref:MazG nucleotide pyrophosphohydrolase domain protein n=1 Tax=Acetivibrio saccincola TaxID=1677857 RepID=A0A2K9E4L4_9FIRM|nr:MazG nucleotide pyrophosphohydrolase domain-containing protein [Acetivibrio saccincola]AUG58662.1 MazG nucleotide pyrophosphohydrolase domain protein [Acetivibrio saccincola]NLN42449.1 nucleotide pyrophosphohydrolase [Clostridiales bacterium]
MNINQLIDIQKQFDSKHRGKFDWAQKIDDENIATLEYLLLCLVGEFGEATNLVKKVLRGDYSLNDIKPQLSEEIADIFIYVLKLAYQLDIDIEKQFLEKVDKNKRRFLNFEMKEKDM